MDDFASTALYNLIAFQLRQVGVDVTPSPRFEGKIDSARKTDLLAESLTTLGAAFVVEIGQGIRSAPANPIVDVLLQARDAGDLLERWQRLECYYHGKHRIEIQCSTQNSVHLKHYSLTTVPPSAGEDLLIAGLVAALLQKTGCEGLSLYIGEPGIKFIRNDEVLGSEKAPADTADWHIEWQRFSSQKPVAILHDENRSITEQLSILMGQDLGKSWRIVTAAQQLGRSTRSLQRSLSEEGTSFQKILRSIRVEGAAKLISSGRFKLAEVGYTCGFSDQAHFSREFKLRFNMSPSQFTDLADH